MNTRKRSESVQFTLRLSQAQAERFNKIQGELNVKSKSDVFDYLVTFASAKRDDQEILFYSLIDRLGEMIGKRLQHVETVNQLHLALTDSFIKYAVSALPDVPAQLLEAARFRGTQIYERINITAAREFQRRRKSDAYEPSSLGIDEDPEALT
ncbi:hypothetical protein [Occallatibacter riparius]|uniref:Uncharacterized protein n=1 Tax=Occallatibacter riparius TaxID=1002689 RepID=A0A9J7BQN0_9BACT|nr:hypothetical protein [Occallatibacter riparius]UWZ85115.1 hypothetical protein MOP44_04025 [Occallatibacter riparius]